MTQRDSTLQDGFTVLELLVAIGLLSVLSGVAAVTAPAVIAPWRLRNAARQIAMDLRDARMRAIHSGTDYRLQIDSDGSGYVLERPNSTGSANVVRHISLPGDMRVPGCTAPGRRVNFRPRGNATSFGTITLQNQNGDQRQIIVDMMGRIRVS